MNKQKLLGILQELYEFQRAYSLPVHAKNPEFESKHLRGKGGKFSKQNPHYEPGKNKKFYSGKASNDALKALKSEVKEVKQGKRKVVHDPHIGYDITTGASGQPVQHPIADGRKGANLERAFHTLTQNGGTSGFTVTYADRNTKAHQNLRNGGKDPMLMYPYYYAGKRENGKDNADHLHDLIQHIQEKHGDKVDLELHRHLGHVKNGGWTSEDHMERVHSNDGGVRQDPQGALGIERSLQGALTIHPKDGMSKEDSEQAIRDVANTITQRAKDTGYLWDVPDMRMIGTAPDPQDENWIKRPMLTSVGNGGIYTMLHQGTTVEDNDSMEKALSGRTIQAHIPKEWNGILGPLDAQHIDAAKSAL